MTMVDLSGWLGAILVLIAYYMISSGRTTPGSHSFQALNISGALCLIYYTYACQAYASMIVNIIWVLIGAGSIIKVIQVSRLNLTRKLIMSKKITLTSALLVFMLFGLSTSFAQDDMDYASNEESEIIEENDSDQKPMLEETAVEEDVDSESDSEE